MSFIESIPDPVFAVIWCSWMWVFGAWGIGLMIQPLHDLELREMTARQRRLRVDLNREWMVMLTNQIVKAKRNKKKHSHLLAEKQRIVHEMLRTGQ